MTEESKDAGDASALAGLRRMVVHARDGLKRSVIGPSWNYSSEAWSPAKVQQYARMLLAVETLTLVADCLPADGGLSADEAQQLTQDHAARIAELERALSAEREARADAEAAMEQALDEAEELGTSCGSASWPARTSRLSSML